MGMIKDSRPFSELNVPADAGNGPVRRLRGTRQDLTALLMAVGIAERSHRKAVPYLGMSIPKIVAPCTTKAAVPQMFTNDNESRRQNDAIWSGFRPERWIQVD